MLEREDLQHLPRDSPSPFPDPERSADNRDRPTPIYETGDTRRDGVVTSGPRPHPGANTWVKGTETGPEISTKTDPRTVRGPSFTLKLLPFCTSDRSRLSRHVHGLHFHPCIHIPRKTTEETRGSRDRNLVIPRGRPARTPFPSPQSSSKSFLFLRSRRSRTPPPTHYGGRHSGRPRNRRAVRRIPGNSLSGLEGGVPHP